MFMLHETEVRQSLGWWFELPQQSLQPGQCHASLQLSRPRTWQSCQQPQRPRRPPRSLSQKFQNPACSQKRRRVEGKGAYRTAHYTPVGEQLLTSTIPQHGNSTGLNRSSELSLPSSKCSTDAHWLLTRHARLCLLGLGIQSEVIRRICDRVGAHGLALANFKYFLSSVLQWSCLLSVKISINSLCRNSSQRDSEEGLADQGHPNGRCCYCPPGSSLTPRTGTRY